VPLVVQSLQSLLLVLLVLLVLATWLLLWWLAQASFAGAASPPPPPPIKSEGKKKVAPNRKISRYPLLPPKPGALLSRLLQLSPKNAPPPQAPIHTHRTPRTQELGRTLPIQGRRTRRHSSPPAASFVRPPERS